MALGVVKEGEGDEGERTHLQFVDISRYDAGWWLVALGAVLRCCGEGRFVLKNRNAEVQSCFRCHLVVSYQEVTPLWTCIG